MKDLCKTCIYWDTGGRATVSDHTQCVCKRYPTDRNTMKHSALDGCGEHKAEPVKKKAAPKKKAKKTTKAPKKKATKKAVKKAAPKKKATEQPPSKQEPDEVSASPDA